MTSQKKPPLTEMVYDILPERMARIPEEKLSEAQRAAIADLTSSRGGVRGSFIALVRCPELMEKVQKMGAYVRFNASLDLRINRVASLLTTRHWSNQFEWYGNTGLALKAGLRAEIIEAIGEGRRPSGMAEDEAIAYDFVTEALVNKSVSDPTYARAVGAFGEAGVLDMLGIVGYYGMLALVMNVVRTPVPDGSPLPLQPLPQVVKPRG